MADNLCSGQLFAVGPFSRGWTGNEEGLFVSCPAACDEEEDRYADARSKKTQRFTPSI